MRLYQNDGGWMFHESLDWKEQDRLREGAVARRAAEVGRWAHRCTRQREAAVGYAI